MNRKPQKSPSKLCQWEPGGGSSHDPWADPATLRCHGETVAPCLLWARIELAVIFGKVQPGHAAVVGRIQRSTCLWSVPLSVCGDCPARGAVFLQGQSSLCRRLRVHREEMTLQAFVSDAAGLLPDVVTPPPRLACLGADGLRVCALARRSGGLCACLGNSVLTRHDRKTTFLFSEK